MKITLLLASYRLCKCRLVIGVLLLVDDRLDSCCIVIGILLLESFRLRRCNVVLTSVFYHYNSLTFEVVKVWLTDNCRTSG